jgi:hypothetical protein
MGELAADVIWKNGFTDVGTRTSSCAALDRTRGRSSLAKVRALEYAISRIKSGWKSARPAKLRRLLWQKTKQSPGAVASGPNHDGKVRDGWLKFISQKQKSPLWKRANSLLNTGGGGRDRTGVHGFAGRCITTLLPRHWVYCRQKYADNT